MLSGDWVGVAVEGATERRMPKLQSSTAAARPSSSAISMASSSMAAGKAPVDEYEVAVAISSAVTDWYECEKADEEATLLWRRERGA